MTATTYTTGIRGTRISVDSHNSVITANETNQLTAQGGKLGHVVVWGVGSGNTLNIYDTSNGTTSGTQVWQWVTATGIGTFVLQLPIQNGIYVQTTGGSAGSFNIVYD